MSRREQITMSEAEILAFLAQERTVTCATFGPRGWPHLMPLWYVLREPREASRAPRIWCWTYGRSQKVRNLERDARATLQVEAGESYDQLRGVVLECEAVIHRELRTVAELGQQIMLRNSVPRGEEALGELPRKGREMIEAQAAKRVGLEFVECRRASWDHRKLGGAY